MTPERWAEIRDAFADVLEHDAADRASILRALASRDAGLAREVENLLAGHDETGVVDELGEWIAPLRPLGDPESSDPRLPWDRVGRYRLLRELGRGGMGTVYLAERDDDFRQQVAVKVLHPAIADAGVSDRFLHERQILASLRHPHIASLLDGGTTTDGTPWFAMELVDGVRIDRWCDDRELSVEDRIRLFLDVCDAVWTAHRNLVVHRDLKPSNVLVTDDGDVALLDFGIAKLLDEGAPRDAVTRSQFPMMTPEYASPEQVRGEPVTTATDVYSLGVMLYELLTGLRPHRLATRTPSEIERLVAETRPTPPSRAVAGGARPGGPDAPESEEDAALERIRSARVRGTTPEGLARRLRGDLDLVVLTALARDPARRYDSAEKLAEDLRRFLAGRPLHARPDSTAYRWSLFVRRHRLGVAAAGALLTSLLAGLGGTVWQAREAREQARAAASERDRAHREALTAERVAAFLVGLFQHADPQVAQGRTPTVAEALETGADRISRELESEPAVRATLLASIAEVRRGLGDYEQARRLAEESLALRRTALGPLDPATAESLHLLAGIVHYEGDLGRAEALHRLALWQRRELLGERHPDVATSLDELADVHYDEGRYDAAEAVYREALEIRREALGQLHEDVATSLNSVGQILYVQGRAQEAEPFLREALAQRRFLLEPEHPDLASSLNNLAVIVDELGDLDAAIPLYRQALEARRRVLGDDHPKVAINLNNLATALVEGGRADEGAEAMLLEAHALTERTLGPGHRRIALISTNLGRLYLDAGRWEEAEQAQRRALEVRRAQLDEEHPDITLNLAYLAAVQRARGDVEGAVAAYRDVIARYGAVLDADHPRLLTSRVRLGQCLGDLGRRDEAREELATAHGLLREKLGSGDRRTRLAAESLAALEAGP